ncbi:hypothetical protein ABPG75_005031 [Micractinium tetrahymenae]
MGSAASFRHLLGLRQEGNALFAAGDYRRAADAYTRALELDADAILFSNRAACHLKLGQAEQVLADAEQATQLRPEWPKGHFRRGCALEALGRLDEAVAAFSAAQEAGGDSRELRDRLKQLRRQLSAQHQDEATARGARGARARSEAGPVRGGPTHGGDSAEDEEPTLPGGPDGWARGLTLAEQYEWLVDCYRMRVDDDMYWGAGKLHGLYLPDPADAKEKWGRENVFAVLFGGRSLRATAELVMGTSCMAMGGEAAPGRREEAAALRRTVDERLPRLLASAAGDAGSADEAAEARELFADVGAAVPWARLLAALGPAVAAAGHWG